MGIAYYPAIIERGPSGFGVFFPDVPGCTSAGDTVEEAFRNAEEALQGHLELLAEDGHPIPPPTPLDKVAVDGDVDEAARVLVRAELPSRAVRVRAASARQPFS